MKVSIISSEEKRKLKIAIFSDSALPVLNGVSISIETLIDELRNRGHSVHLFAPKFPKYRNKDPHEYRFRSMETPFSKGYPIAFPPFYRMLKFFRSQQWDIIHTHTPFVLGFVALRWSESQQIPIVSTYHTLYDKYAHYFRAFPRRYIRFRIAKHTNFYFNSVTRVITPTKASAKWLKRHGVTKPIDIIPTGIPLPQMLDRSTERANLGIAPNTKMLLYVGRLAKEKNIETLLEMYAFVKEKNLNARLFLIGDGPFREEALKIAAKLGIGDMCKFIGFIPRKEVDRYYASADLFVFPSVTETQGLVVQEAMMYGLPAVVVAGGGASESIEEGANGLIVPNNSQLYAESVLSLLENEELYTKLQINTRKFAKENSIVQMVDRILNVYQKAIGEYESEVKKAEALLV